MKKKQATESLVVTSEECEEMQRWKRCSAGPLKEEGGIYTTDRDPGWYYPSGGIHCCRWRSFETVNCFLVKAYVYKRHNEATMESTAGDVSHCDYDEGRCALKDNTYLRWVPNKSEQCQFLPWKRIPGKRRTHQWVSDDGNLGLTFRTQSFGYDCHKNEVTISDQGIPFREMCTRSARVKRRTHGGDGAPLPQEQPIAVVTADQLAASLQALEIKMNDNIQFSFSRAIGEACSSMVHASMLLRASVLSNPTITLRGILAHPYIYARASGDMVETWPCQPVANYTFTAMTAGCTYEIPINFYLGNRVLK